MRKSSYTLGDVQAIRKYFPKHGGKWDQWDKILTFHHSYYSIRGEARKLGVRISIAENGWEKAKILANRRAAVWEKEAEREAQAAQEARVRDLLHSIEAHKRKRNTMRRLNAEKVRRSKRLSAYRANRLAQAFNDGRISARMLDQIAMGVCQHSGSDVRKLASKLKTAGALS